MAYEDFSYGDEVVVERIGSPIGHKIVKAKTVRGGVKVKAEGTPMEILTVAAVLINQLMWDYGVPLHEVFGAVEDMIKDATLLHGTEETHKNTKGDK